MRRSPHHPDDVQALLLRAAFADLPTAAGAWAAWRRHGRPPDAGTERLLPQVYRHLHRSVDDPSLHALAPAYRLTWVRNQVRAGALGLLLRDLDADGIPALVLKGGALAVVAYADWGARPMTDFDVLVRRGAAEEAIAWLGGRGFRPSTPLPAGFIDDHHGAELQDAAGQRLDLHWSLAHECCGAGDLEGVWQARTPLALGSTHAATLCATDHLFHVIVHGARSGATQPVGWAADALALLTRCADAVDWDRLVAHTREHEVGVPVASAVGWLHGQVPALVPEAALDAVRRVPAPRWQRVEHAIKVRPRPLVGTLPVLPFDHHRLRGRRARAPGLARYLQRTFRVERLSQLPRASARLAIDRLRGWLQPSSGSRTVRPMQAALVGGTARMLVGEFFVLASGVGTAAILSRVLGVAGYGVFGLVAAVVYWAELTLPMLYSRAVLSAKAERDRDFDAGVLWLYTGTGILFASAIILGAPLAGRWLGAEGIAGHLMLFAVDVPIAALATGQRVLLVARGAYARVAAVGTARAAARFGLIAAALAWRPDVTSAIVASIAASVLELGVGTALIGAGWPRRPRLPRLDVRGAIVPLAASSLSLRLYRRLDLLMVQAIARSDVATGLYGAAQNVSLVLTTINNTLSPALLSSLSRLGPDAEEARRHLAAAALRVLLLPLPALAFCAGSAAEISALVYGEPFRPAGPVMGLLAVASYAEILGAVASAPLIAAGRVAPLVVATAPLVPLAALGHAWAVPRLGTGGAAAVTLMLAVACALAVIRSAVRLRLLEGAGRGAAVAALVGGLWLAAARALAPAGWAVVPAALAAGIAGAALLVAAGVVPAADLAGIGRAAGRGQRPN